MKKIFSLRIAAFGVLLAGLIGCNSILEDVEPPTSVSFEVALSDADAVLATRAALFASMRNSMAYTTQLMVGPGALADETRFRPGASRYQDLNTAVGTAGTVHLTHFGASYAVIRNANLLIGGIQPGTLPEATLNRYRGEALAIRAFAYHHLARTYGYEPGNTGIGELESDWNLAVMLRTEPALGLDQAQPIPRNTVTEVYDQIRADLTEAKTLLQGINADNSYPTEAFVDGIRARVELYAGNWSEAATAAQAAITNSGRSLVNTEAGVAGMFATRNPEALFEIVVNPNTEPIGGSNVNNGLAAYTGQQWVAQVPSQRLIDQYGADDWRLSGWYANCLANQVAGAPANGCEQVNNLAVTMTKWNGSKGNLADDIPYMRIGEMYLIWAEAAAKAANNPAAGVAPLQALRDARNAGPIPAAALLSMEAFETEILNERMRELAGEGHRFFDLKRLGRHIPNVQGDIKIRFDSYRILAPFGTAQQNINPFLVENPGYTSVN